MQRSPRQQCLTLKPTHVATPEHFGAMALEVLLSSQAVPCAVGNEQGYLVGMSQAVMETPLQMLPGQNVTIESNYDATDDHFGVMALFFLDLVGFNSSCPGPVTPATGPLSCPAACHANIVYLLKHD